MSVTPVWVRLVSGLAMVCAVIVAVVWVVRRRRRGEVRGFEVGRVERVDRGAE